MRAGAARALACALLAFAAAARAQDAGPGSTEDDAAKPSAAPEPAPAQDAPAEEIYAVAQSAAASYLVSPGAKLSDALLLPAGELELGGELVFLTSSSGPTRGAIDFSDIGLLRIRARASPAENLELFAMTQLLIKQPGATDEPLWQGAAGGARFGFAEHFALGLQASAGPLLNDPGFYAGAGPMLLAKVAIDRLVRFELGLGYAFTALQPGRKATRGFMLHEAVASAEAQLGSGDGAFFVGFEYRLPIASGPAADRLEPGARLGFELGGVLCAGHQDDWDLFALFAVVDRGEADDPATTLPILDGGFDQHQWLIGVQHRFGKSE
jgi:hypothetical protein